MKIIDLFCGAGGFSLGARLAGFEMALAVDKDPILTSAYLRNFPDAKLSLQDIQHASGESLLADAGVEPGEEIGIIGGPPCQGFSLMGKRSVSDPRNTLLQHYFRIISEIRPKFFVMENVPGLLLGDSKGLLVEATSQLAGYEVLGPLKLDANDYGAATHRERVLLIGFRGQNPITPSLLKQAKKQDRVTVSHAIADLPAPHESGSAKYANDTPLSLYALDARRSYKHLGSKEAKDRMANGIVNGIHPTKHSTDVVTRFRSVAQGKHDPISRCPRLHWDAAAPTLRAGTGPDHGSFQSVRPIHPEHPRVITVREAARIQGFPDWFEFHPTKWHSFRMIGNSVSPCMSLAIMSLIATIGLKLDPVQVGIKAVELHVVSN